MFSHYIILDFEATCEAHQRIPNPEIIEFPFVIVNARTHAMECEFRRYVRPVIRPRLSSFCTHLTGITQTTVNASQTFPSVYHEALQFLQERNFSISGRQHQSNLSDENKKMENWEREEEDGQLSKEQYCIVTCGDWDLETMLPCQLALCVDNNLPFPSAWQKWCNLKVWVREHLHDIVHSSSQNVNNYNANSKYKPLPRINDLPDLLQVVNLELCGKHHSGLDDCRNIARVVCALLDRGFFLNPTKSIAKSGNTNNGNNTNSFTKLPLQCAPEQHQLRLREEDLNSHYENKRHESSVSMADGQVKVYRGVEIKEQQTNKLHKSQEIIQQQQTLSSSNKQFTNSEGSSENTIYDVKRERTRCQHESEDKNATVMLPNRTHVIIDTTRDAIHDILTSTHSQPNLQVCRETNLSSAIERKVSHSLSNILRHGADRMHVAISTEGFVNVHDLLGLPELKKYNVCLLDLAFLVQHNDKQRFCLYYGTSQDQDANYKNDDSNDKNQELYIAANQGHSLPNVTPLLTKITSPYVVKPQQSLTDNNNNNNSATCKVNVDSQELKEEEELVAIHGTSLSAWETIKSCGFLSPMGRQHIHFALMMMNNLPVQELEEQTHPEKQFAISGLRKNAEVWLYLDVARALDDGIELWQSKNNVLLTCGEGTSRTLPLKYIKRAVLAKTKTKLAF